MNTAARGWRNRIVGHDEVPAESIMPNPLNWRAHPTMQKLALSGVLSEVGWVQDVVVNKTTGNLIDGHLRVDIARQREELVPVVYVELSEEEERLILATLDPLAALATTDEEALRELLLQVSTTDETLADLLSRMAAGETDIDSEYEPAEAPGRGLSHLALIVPTEEVEWLRATLIAYADTVKLEGWVDERMGRAVIQIVREHERKRAGN